MIRIPLENYQFTGIIAIIGTILSILTIDHVNESFPYALLFSVSAIAGIIGSLVTIILFFCEHVRFKN